MNANALAAVAFKTTLPSSTRAPPAADAMQPIELPSMGTYDSEEDDDDDAVLDYEALRRQMRNNEKEGSGRITE